LLILKKSLQLIGVLKRRFYTTLLHIGRKNHVRSSSLYLLFETHDSMPISPTGLQKNSKTGAYYLRRRIPADLLSSYPGKKEIVFSLRTKEYRTAVERLRLEDAKLTTEWIQRRQLGRG
jgi:hypothetical protein